MSVLLILCVAQTSCWLAYPSNKYVISFLFLWIFVPWARKALNDFLARCNNFPKSQLVVWQYHGDDKT